MKFSFVIPALNEEKYISKCINSIKKQINKNDEIIIVDNGCQDKTTEIAKKLGCVIVKEKNKGISHARNKGAKQAKGDILCFIDADGVINKNWLKEAREKLSDTKLMAVSGINIFCHPKLTKKIIYNTYTLVIYLFLIIFKILTGKSFLPGNNLAIRKDIFNQLKGFEPFVAEDYWFSKKFWKLRNNKAVLSLKMIIYYSSRGFDQAGFLKTIICWSKSLLRKTGQEKYDYKNKNL